MAPIARTENLRKYYLAVAYYIANRVAIMYAGKIVEYGNVNEVFSKPMHPYTQLLMKSIPTIGRKSLEPPTGEVPSLVNPPPGCRFHPRCPYVMDICKQREPELINVDGRRVACWLYSK